MKNQIIGTLLLTLAIQAAPAQTPQTSPSPAPRPPAVEIKDEPPVVQKHSVTVKGRTLNYTTPIRDRR